MDRVHVHAPPVQLQPLSEVHVPQPLARPADHLSRPDVLTVRDDAVRVHVPVAEVADRDLSVLTRTRGSSLRQDRSAALDGVDPVGAAGRRSWLRPVVANADVDPEVIRSVAARP